MITINLLPEEYRRTARTPLKLMAAVSGAVAVNTSLLAWWCWMSFGSSFAPPPSDPRFGRRDIAPGSAKTVFEKWRREAERAEARGKTA